MSDKIYSMVYDRVAELIEKEGVLPWQRPWQGVGVEPANFVSKKAYRGINPFMLSLAGYGCPFWVSYKQAKKLGGQVKKGSKSMPVIFWKWLDKKVKLPDGTEETDRFPMLRYYNVFNLEQCEGIEWSIGEKKDIPPIEHCEKIVSEMPKKPKIEHGKTGAWYSPTQDSVGIPDRGYFLDSEKYYSTLFHELTHSTGHDSRLGRHKKNKCNHRFGSKDYSKEELVAEFGAAFLCAKTGIENRTIDNSAAYLKSWVSKLEKNKKWLVQAAAQAQKSTDFILGKKYND
jgi:antirestriction protein ArdC